MNSSWAFKLYFVFPLIKEVNYNATIYKFRADVKGWRKTISNLAEK